MKKTLSVITLAFLISGCSLFSLSEEQCRHMDWYAKGRTDALNGESMGSISGYSKQCSKYSIVPNKRDYTNGFNQGLEQFCTYERGKEYGYLGRFYKNTCPTHLEENFIKGYKYGKKKRKIEELKEKQEKLENKIETIEQREEDVSGFRKYF